MPILGSKLKKRSAHVSHLLETKLWLQVLIGMVLGIMLGIILSPDAAIVNAEKSLLITNWLALPGNLFLQLIKLVVIPLVFSSIIVGILSSGSPKFIKKIGPKLALYFIITTTIAVLIGLAVTSIIQPGSFVDVPQTTTSVTEQLNFETINIPEALINILPSNVLETMVNEDMFGIIILTIIFGIALLHTNKKHRGPAMNLLETIQTVSMTVVKWAMHLAPIAVFGLMTKITAEVGLSALAGLSMYVLTVLLGLLILVIFYNLIIWIFTKTSPLKFMDAIKEAQLLAFSTSSSAAVMPLSIKTAEDELKVKPSIARFLIPVGATVNMDGTALYQTVATLFLAQVFGVHLSFLSILLIIVITVCASIGAPSAPGVGIIILATILASVGIPVYGIALILAVDRILDMSRTTVNVTGDLTACLFFNKYFSKFFKR